MGKLSRNATANIPNAGEKLKRNASAVVQELAPVGPVFSLVFSIEEVSPDFTIQILEMYAENGTATGFYISESPVPPLPTDSGWVFPAPTEYVVNPVSGSVTLYAWAKDASDNVTPTVFDTVFVDVSRPVVTSFDAKEFNNTLDIQILSFTAVDDYQVAGYIITESATPPAANDPNWTPTAPTTYTVGSDGTYNLYGWAKDTVDNISLAVPADEVYVKTVLPVVTGFTVEQFWPNNDIPILTFTGSADATHYLVTESATTPDVNDPNWSATAPTVYTVTGTSEGQVTLYAWVKDDQFELISVSVQDTTFIDKTPPVITSFTMPATSETTLVPVLTFDVTEASGQIWYLINQSATTPDVNDPNWTQVKPTEYEFGADGTLTAYAWAKDAVNQISTSVSQTVEIAPSITYLLNDQFLTDEAAPMVTPRTAEPGPGNATIRDTDDILHITGQELVTTDSGGTTTPILTYDLAILKADIGRTFLTSTYKTTGGNANVYGYSNVANASAQTRELGYQIRGDGLRTVISGNYGSALLTFTGEKQIELAVIIGSNTVYFFARMTGDLPNWTLLAIKESDSVAATLYASTNHARPARTDYMIIPEDSILPTHLAYDDFSQPATVAVDSGDNNLDGTIAGPMGLGGSNGMFFDGTNSYVDIYSAGLNNTFNGQESSAILRFKAAEASIFEDSTLRYLLSIRASTSNYLYITKEAADNRMRINYRASGVSRVENIEPFSSTANTGLGVKFSFSGDVMRIYLNGSQHGTDITSLGQWIGDLASNVCKIGSQVGTVAHWFGWIQDTIITLNGVVPIDTQIEYLTNPANTITKTYLDTEFGVGNYVWYKLDEINKTLAIGPESQPITQRDWITKTGGITADNKYKVTPVGSDLSTQIGSVTDTQTQNVYAQANSIITDLTQAGFMLLLDNPDNPQDYIHIYFNRNDASIYIDKVESGAVTPIVNVSTTYSSDATLAVRYGTDNSLWVFYNDSYVTNQTVTPPANGGNYHALFATNPDTRMDNVKILEYDGYTIFDQYLP